MTNTSLYKQKGKELALQISISGQHLLTDRYINQQTGLGLQIKIVGSKIQQTQKKQPVKTLLVPSPSQNPVHTTSLLHLF